MAEEKSQADLSVEPPFKRHRVNNFKTEEHLTSWQDNTTKEYNNTDFVDVIFVVGINNQQTGFLKKYIMFLFLFLILFRLDWCYF